MIKILMKNKKIYKINNSENKKYFNKNMFQRVNIKSKLLNKKI